MWKALSSEIACLQVCREEEDESHFEKALRYGNGQQSGVHNARDTEACAQGK